MAEPKCLFFDIESTNLNATFGTILCIGYHWLGEPDETVKIPTLMDFVPKKQRKGFGWQLDDKGLVEHFAKVYDWADFTVGHYSSRFDIKMIQAKLIKYGLPPLGPKRHIDTWEIARRNFKLHSNRLGVLADFLGVEHSKNPITWDDWRHAALGSEEGLARVVEHCRLDVLVLRDVYVRLRPWSRQEPSRRLFMKDDPEACIRCGSLHVIRKGFKVTTTQRYQQYQCQDCGSWQRDKHLDRAHNNTIVSS